MSGANPSYVASADVASSRFVKITGDNTVAQASAGTDDVIGVTHEGSREAPIPGVTPLAAKQGESCRVYGLGETCEVEVGAGALTAGAVLKSDANGKAVAATSTDSYYAKALAGAAANTRIKVQITRGKLP